MTAYQRGQGQVLRPCLDCGRLSPRGRCPTHERAKDRQRGSTTARGYGTEHQQARAQAIATYSPDDPCARCGEPLGPDPELLDLGHTDDRAGYGGLEHRAYNRGRRPRPPT